MNKKMTKKLRELARLCPQQTSTTPSTKIVKGVDLIAKGIKHLPDGKAIEENKYYNSRSPQDVNHFRKLKAVYTSKGLPGVQDYVNQFKTKG